MNIKFTIINFLLAFVCTAASAAQVFNNPSATTLTFPVNSVPASRTISIQIVGYPGGIQLYHYIKPTLFINIRQNNVIVKGCAVDTTITDWAINYTTLTCEFRRNNFVTSGLLNSTKQHNYTVDAGINYGVLPIPVDKKWSYVVTSNR